MFKLHRFDRLPSVPRGRERSLLAGLSITVIAVVFLVAGFALYQQYQSLHARIESNTASLATSLVQTVDGVFDTIDLALQVSADEIQRQESSKQPDRAAIRAFLTLQASRLNHVAFIRGTNRDGDVVYGPDLPATTVNLAERAFFQVLKANPRHGLFVAKPLVGKISSRAVLSLARPIFDAQGNFAGTVYASIYVSELEKLLNEFKMPPNSALTLRDRDLGMLARQTFGAANPIPMGSRQLSQPFQAALARNRDAGSFTSDSSSLDPLVRHFSYRRSSNYGYTALVGSPFDSDLAEWRRQAWLLGGVALIFAAVVLRLATLIARTRARLERLVNSLRRSRDKVQGNHRRLREAEAERRSLLDNLNTAVIVHAPDTQIIFSNRQASKLLRLSRDQMSGKTAIDPDWHFVDASGQPLLPEDYPVNRVLKNLEPIADQVIGVQTSAHDSLTWFMLNAFPEFDAQHQLKQVVVNFHDITSLREADERWRFAVEGSGDGVWDYNMRTGQAVYSLRYQEMLGYAEGEFPPPGTLWIDHVHPDDLEQVEQVIEQHLRDPSASYATEFRMRCKHGEYKWIYARGMIVSRLPDGQGLRMVGTHTDISALKAAEAKIWSEANFDALTRLPNRRLFYDRLDMKLRKAQRDSEHVALLFVDLDHFKEVNDTLGHHMGDQLLREAAQRIQSVVRDSDTVARLGGDEFTVILSDPHPLAATGGAAQKIIARLSEPYRLGDADAYVSASIGIALYPDDADNVNDLIKNADQAMYAAKAGGRKNFCFFTKAMQDAAVTRMSLVNDLRQALVGKQLEVHYQPIVDLCSGRIVKAEALVRWRHPERGMVSPADFIPAAEAAGIIQDIDAWVLRQASQQLVQWQAAHQPDFQLSINTSPMSFVGDQHGQHAWIGVLEELGLSGKSLVIEITEGILMDNSASVVASLIACRDVGIQVAIDDFGTGYSSLAYLRKFDIDYLKIDQSFIRTLAPDTADFALCEAIIVMAHKLGLKVIAEGVETAAQRELLCQIGCDFGQGYLIARPLDAAAFGLLLEQQKATPQAACMA